MQIAELDHYFVWAMDLEKSRAFYCDVLGFEVLPRPAARLPGYWLGVNGHVKVHMGLDEKALAAAEAGTAPQSARNSNSVVDHIGFVAMNPEGFSNHFRQLGVPARERYIESMKLLQIILTDPDGLTVELNFPDIAVEPSWMKRSAA